MTLLIPFFIPGMAGGLNAFLAIAECSAGMQPVLQRGQRARHVSWQRASSGPAPLHLRHCSRCDEERRQIFANSDYVSLRAVCAAAVRAPRGHCTQDLLLVPFPLRFAEAAAATGEVRAVLHKYLAQCSLCLEGLIV